MRKDKNSEKHNITCPQLVKDYNRYMGGVDHTDQLHTSYGVDQKLKMWWYTIFWDGLDIFIKIYL